MSEDHEYDPCMKTELEVVVGKSDGEFCGELKVNGEPCRQLAGWGTVHPAIGPCRHHGGMKPGPHNKKDDFKPLTTYSGMIRNTMLRDLVMQAERGGSLDSLDAELALLKGVIGMIAQMIGVLVVSDPDTGEIQYIESMQDFDEQTAHLLRTVNTITNTYKTKFNVLVQMKEAIPRSEVRAYVESIKNVLELHLRDDCPHCHRHIGILSDVLKDMANLEHL